MTEHAWSTPRLIAKLSKISIGIELASQVEDMLYNSRTLANYHRDYCGHGLDYHDSAYRLFTVLDGQVDNILQTWDAHGKFVEFLARQSDYSLSGADKNEPILYTEDSYLLNNQTLTKASLENIANFHYSEKQMEIFDFFIQSFSQNKQDALKAALLKLDSPFETAVATLLSSKKQKITFEINRYSASCDVGIEDDDCNFEDVADELNHLSSTQGISDVFRYENTGSSVYTVVSAYNDFLQNHGYRFIYWVEELYDFMGFIIKEDSIDYSLAFAQKYGLTFQAVLPSNAYPSWFKSIETDEKDSKKSLKAILKQEAAKAKKLGRNLFLYTSMEECRPCKILENNITHPKMLSAFENTVIKKIDIIRNMSELYRNFLKANSAPIFTYISPDGIPTDHMIEGDAWGDEDTVDNMSHALAPFFKKTKQVKPRAQQLSQSELGDILSIALSNSNFEHIKWMIKISNYDVSTKNCALLHQANQLDDPLEFIDYLMSNGADINAQSPAGNTALQNSILYENQKITEKLLSYGADINTQTYDGESILILLIELYWYDDQDEWYDGGSSTWYDDKLYNLIRYALSLGADKTLKNNNGDDALNFAIKFNPSHDHQQKTIELLKHF